MQYLQAQDIQPQQQPLLTLCQAPPLTLGPLRWSGTVKSNCRAFAAAQLFTVIPNPCKQGLCSASVGFKLPLIQMVHVKAHSPLHIDGYGRTVRRHLETKCFNIFSVKKDLLPLTHLSKFLQVFEVGSISPFQPRIIISSFLCNQVCSLEKKSLKKSPPLVNRNTNTFPCY